jgi:hypothetical protein
MFGCAGFARNSNGVFMSSRREFIQVSASMPFLPLSFAALSGNADAFVPVLIRALLGSYRAGAIADASVATRVVLARNAARSAGKELSEQLTVATSATQHVLRPKVWLRNKTSTSQFVGSLHLTEHNLNEGTTRSYGIAPTMLPAEYDEVRDYSLPGWNYRRGLDYLREVISVDRCGCAKKLESELVVCV